MVEQLKKGYRLNLKNRIGAESMGLRRGIWRIILTKLRAVR